MMEEFKPDLINSFIDQLQPKNLRLMLKSKEVKDLCDKTEPIYESIYSINPLPQEIVEVNRFSQPINDSLINYL